VQFGQPGDHSLGGHDPRLDGVNENLRVDSGKFKVVHISTPVVNAVHGKEPSLSFERGLTKVWRVGSAENSE
jgi:hypothetical protein